MNKISCDICMDLIPLVSDGVASEDSIAAVNEHVKSCPSCNALLKGNHWNGVDSEKIFARFQRKMQVFYGMLMMLGIMVGVSLTASSEMFYNSLIMPVIGVLAYIMFRWKSLYVAPLLVFGTHCILNMLSLVRGAEYLDLYSLIMWTFIYSIFAWIGVVIAGLLQFALRKE